MTCFLPIFRLFSSRSQLGPFALAAALLLTGCGRKSSETAVQDSVDFTDPSNLFSAPLPSEAGLPPPETVVATVDGKSITFADLRKEVNILMVNLGRATLPPEQTEQYRARLSEQAMQNLVIKALLAEAIQQESVTVTDEDLDAQLRTFQERVPEGVSLPQLLEQNGLTEAGFRDDLRLSMRVEKLLQSKVQNLEAPTEEEVNSFYQAHPEQFEVPERITIRHLLAKAQNPADEKARREARSRLEGLVEKLQQGADFAQLAAEFSDDLPNREQGGLLPGVRRGQLPPPLDEAAFALEPGQLSPIVESQFGFHVVRLEEKTPAGTVALAEAKPRIAAHLMRERQKAALESYVNALKEKASITFPQR